MFSPNVWKFDSPNTQISHKYGELDGKNEKQICKRIYGHPFNRMISIILPETKELPSTVIPLLQDTDHYQIDELPLTEFIKKTFIEAFIKNGQFYSSSVNTRIDVDDCVCVTPDGLLRLSLTKDVYHRLGLEGKVSSFAKKHQNRYTVVIDLKSKDLISTTKYYARVQNSLSNESLPKFAMRFMWIPPKNAKICPSSVAKYLNDLGHEVKQIQTECKKNFEYGLKVPLLGPDTDEPIEVGDKSAFYATPHELVEYAGMVALSCDLKGSEYLNSYSFTGHSIEVGSALTVKLKGMFPCDLIRMLFKNLRNYANQNPDIPWVMLYIHGDQHAPVSFSGMEHTFTHNGDNSYALFLCAPSKYMYYEVLSSNKALK